MREINNPFTKINGYKCFACSPDNPIGLQMNFFEDGDYICSNWTPNPNMVGYGNIIHGGIQSTLIDEISAWVIYIKEQAAGVTSRLNVKYLKPAYSNKGNLLIRGKIVKKMRNFCEIYCEILDTNNTKITEANVVFCVFSEEISRNQYHYPGIENFFTKDEN